MWVSTSKEEEEEDLLEILRTRKPLEPAAASHTHDDFPLPVAPMMAFSPGFMIPLRKIEMYLHVRKKLAPT